MHKSFLKYIYAILSLLLFVEYIPAQNIERDETANGDDLYQDTINIKKINSNLNSEQYYYPPMKHLMLEMGGSTVVGTLGTMAIGSIIHPTENANTNGEISDIYQPFDIPIIYCTISSITVYVVGRSLKTRGSLVWSVGMANVIPLGIMSYGYISGKPEDYRPAVYVSSIFAPLMATVAYNITAVQQSKKDLKHSCNSTINTCIAWKSNDITKKANPYIIIQYNF
ncbi:MAG: hypothetical protein A2509_07655 [Candidatus Edwardsbacteria bacterium RIFOXYD12_FULL_50_11]|uniref:Uncharacterized protein n=1 Tax=Candidatus Edwardsbacteria bacterium GWF2_54_11 TaxID=1817851 RepID=A0A1F5REM7_9BACT|nr:MAG: hypothetical protein A2502_12460 [Candidatus Edwardsbacteria bacterium RifOxyC12_full_54_24]OGF06547.1 MAG: hypothetical protein A2273_11695 [Candidatus Edwardsbacteria bacterium RifOxyA12_full_54_48]OGF12767.1 MAG: hypothetical protein A3K15_00080 [Candidatus Edwardsbacteria bacterium GWE2_54_12]OGF12828.1 MAG: hypothetical protein A2024_12190 [Candidatus Edwardsbacteria bacterium GWF2_54_11]OGF17865.1 MAG: hypothetical protein A2509_07655 [Candidatus Edwardsbacteria bacterium RIFOXYD1